MRIGSFLWNSILHHLSKSVNWGQYRIIKKWFTMTNIKFGNNREIDILAVDASGKGYQIEVDIHKGGLQWGPCGNDGYSVQEYKKKKFDKKTKNFIRQEFGIKESKDIWVCWGIHPNA